MSIFTNNSSRTFEKGALKHLVVDHKMDAAILHRDYKCVYKPFIEGTGYLCRVFRPADMVKCGVAHTDYATFDTHPELIVFDGVLMGKKRDDAYLERRRA